MTSPTSMPPIAPAVANPHFNRIGGQEAVGQLVESFYRWMDTLPEATGIRAMHEPDLSQTKATLRLYLNEWLGGPRLYTAERGRPALRRKHLPFSIGQSEVDAWLLCMSRALDEVVSDAVLRAELLSAFARTAQVIRNDRPHPPSGSHNGPTPTTLVL
jgi:hemoglobin